MIWKEEKIREILQGEDPDTVYVMVPGWLWRKGETFLFQKKEAHFLTKIIRETEKAIAIQEVKYLDMFSPKIEVVQKEELEQIRWLPKSQITILRK